MIEIASGVRKLKFRAVDSKNMITMLVFPLTDHFIVSAYSKSKQLPEQGRKDPLSCFGKCLLRNLIGKVDIGEIIADSGDILMHGTMIGMQ